MRSLAFVAAVLLSQSAAATDRVNGFDLSDTLVPHGEIARGGPQKDGIPALTDPAFVTAAEATFVAEDDRVIGVARNGLAKAYPLALMNWHEIVNDRFGDEEAVVVTYCPLCFTGMAFEATLGGARLLFGVSGLLYNSDVLLYDRRTESLWSQLQQQAISGPMKGQRLGVVPSVNTTWREWRRRHPQTLVLSSETGHLRHYDRDPYAAYDQSPDIMFPVRFRAQGYHPKEYVIGIELDGIARAYPVSELAQGPAEFGDRIGKQTVIVRYDDSNVSGEIRDEGGALLPFVQAYWFAWYAFHPDTQVYKHADVVENTP